ncbi:hypothetical protein F5051DRAFT_457060 [Lentinula edodes]|nr:hypothetical protein F5051DRAFT_457060 [Lentinula edodes]
MNWNPHLHRNQRVIVWLVNSLACAFTLAPAVSAVKSNPPYITALGAIGAILSLGSSILASSRSSAEPHPREVASLGTRVMEAQMSADIENHLLQQKQFQFPKRQLGRVLLLDSVARTSVQRSGILLQSPLGACVAPQEVHLRDDCSAADRQTQMRTVTPRIPSLVSISTESLPSSTSCSSFYHSFSPPSSILPLSVPLSTSPPSCSSLPSVSSLLLSAPSPGSSPIVTPSDLSVCTSSETNLPSVTLESPSSSPPLPPLLPTNLHYVSSITSHSMSTPSILPYTDHVLAPSLPSSLCKTCLVGVKGQRLKRARVTWPLDYRHDEDCPSSSFLRTMYSMLILVIGCQLQSGSTMRLIVP